MYSSRLKLDIIIYYYEICCYLLVLFCFTSFLFWFWFVCINQLFFVMLYFSNYFDLNWSFSSLAWTLKSIFNQLSQILYFMNTPFYWFLWDQCGLLSNFSIIYLTLFHWFHIDLSIPQYQTEWKRQFFIKLKFDQ